MTGRPEGPGGKRICLRFFRLNSHSKTMSSPAEISVTENSIVYPNERSPLKGKIAERAPGCSLTGSPSAAWQTTDVLPALLPLHACLHALPDFSPSF